MIYADTDFFLRPAEGERLVEGKGKEGFGEV